MNTYALVFNHRYITTSLLNMLKTTYERAGRVGRIYVYITIDDDDNSSIHFLKNYCRKLFKLNVSWRLVQRTYNLIRNINEVCLNTSHTFYWGLNSDIEIVTKDWDLILDFYLDKYKNKVYTAYMYDDTLTHDATKQFCCFPIVTRKYIQTMGCYMPVEIHNAGADDWFHRIICGASENRIIHVPIELKHFKYSDPDFDKIPPLPSNPNAKGHLEKWEMANYLKRLNTAIEMGL